MGEVGGERSRMVEVRNCNNEIDSVSGDNVWAETLLISRISIETCPREEKRRMNEYMRV